MNERIIQLSKQAGDYVNEVYTPPVRSKTPGKIWEDGHVGWHTQFNQKFAELIVRECISMADKESERYSNLDQEYCSMAMDNYRELVRKHFGVKE
jgi:hypothetical protein